MATIVDIADGLVARLNGRQFAAPFQAVRSFRPRYDLEDLKDLHVTVVPRSAESRNIARIVVETDVQIDIAVQCKLATTDDGEIAGLLSLVEEIAEFLHRPEANPLPRTAFIRCENAPLYSQEHLAEWRQFTSVLTATYRVMPPHW